VILKLATDTRRLVLLRHAKAEPAGSVPDNLRPLALNGRRQASAVGGMLKELGIVPDAVLVSSALRTRQTWELLSNGLDLETSFAQFHDDLYVAQPCDVLSILAGHGSATTVLVVGHEPTMSTLATLLSGPGSDQKALDTVRFGLPTSGFAVLESSLEFGQWDQDSAVLVAHDRPAV